MRPTALTTLACLLLSSTLACTGVRRPAAERDAETASPSSPDAPVDDPDDPVVRPADPELARAVDRALERALADGALEDVSVHAECGDDGALSEVRIFGSGVGIWNRTRQFRLPRERVAALVERFRAVGFSRFQDIYGAIEREIPVPQDEGASALRVICQVTLTVGDVTKRSSQLSKGPRSEELRELATEVLAAGRGPGASGETAASLDEGLAKIAEGVLAPEVLRLILHRKPDPRALAAGEPGFLLRVEGGEATVQPIAAQGGYGDPVALGVGGPDLSSLAGVLAENRVGGLPVNLYADHYTDFVVEVLGRELVLQARAFTGMTPTAHGEAQERFDRVYDRLAALAARGPG